MQKRNFLPGKNEYNTERPHSSLGYRAPLEGRIKTSNVEAITA